MGRVWFHLEMRLMDLTGEHWIFGTTSIGCHQMLQRYPEQAERIRDYYITEDTNA